MKAEMVLEEFCGLVKSDRPALVGFLASWCPYCQRMQPVLEDLKKRAGDRMSVMLYDIDDKDNSRLMDYYHVKVVPMLLVFRSGEILWRKDGVIRQNQLEQVIGRLLA